MSAEAAAVAPVGRLEMMSPAEPGAVALVGALPLVAKAVEATAPLEFADVVVRADAVVAVAAVVVIGEAGGAIAQFPVRPTSFPARLPAKSPALHSCHPTPERVRGSRHLLHQSLGERKQAVVEEPAARAEVPDESVASALGEISVQDDNALAAFRLSDWAQEQAFGVKQESVALPFPVTHAKGKFHPVPSAKLARLRRIPAAWWA